MSKILQVSPGKSRVTSTCRKRSTRGSPSSEASPSLRAVGPSGTAGRTVDPAGQKLTPQRNEFRVQARPVAQTPKGFCRAWAFKAALRTSPKPHKSAQAVAPAHLSPVPFRPSPNLSHRRSNFFLADLTPFLSSSSPGAASSPISPPPWSKLSPNAI